MIPNSILVTNGKGGVGKTSLVANVAGLAAASGWRTLAIDTDPQGNLARDLGVLEAADDGTNLHEAILGRTSLAPITSVRDRLDLAPGGPALDGLTSEIHTIMARGQYLTALTLLETALTPITGDYDLIIIDSPPGERALQTLAARAAHHLVIPTAPDDCSIDGLGAVFGRFQHLRTEGGNPELNMLGVALTLTVTQATAVQRRVRHTLSELLDDRVEVFASTVRFAQAAAVACRRDGRLAHEYEQVALNAEPRYATTGPVEAYSRAATGLASDYQNLTNEILTAHTNHQLRRPA
ncbi:MAG: ParA family protein [Actinomycetes bacterium]|jgi:chromosome partitioning protein|uniref:Unannotated protein n=1 Tax=freshwater metagenome TaxID=449393 RepID=A0A6J6D4V8_9ZZZZ|nr:AAA family ATPase [Actinomycetota bacterium]